MYQTKQALDVLVQQIDQKVKQIEENLGAKSAKDFSDYQKLCGEIRGLSIAEGFILDLAKTMELSDD